MDKQKMNKARPLLVLSVLTIVLLTAVGYVLYNDAFTERALTSEQSEQEEVPEGQVASEEIPLEATDAPGETTQTENIETRELVPEVSPEVESLNEQTSPSFFRAAEVTVQPSSDFSADIRNVRVIEHKINYLPGVEVLGPVVEFELDLSMHTFEESKGSIEFTITKELPLQTTSESGHLYLYAIRDGDYANPLVLSVTGYDRAVGKVTVSLIELYTWAETGDLGKNLVIISQPVNFDSADW